MLVPLFAPRSAAEIVVISVLAGIGEELLFRGVLQAASGPGRRQPRVRAVSRRRARDDGAWRLGGGIGGLLGWLAIATGGLLAPIVAHALYDVLALSYIRWGPATSPEHARAAPSPG